MRDDLLSPTRPPASSTRRVRLAIAVLVCAIAASCEQPPPSVASTDPATVPTNAPTTSPASRPDPAPTTTAVTTTTVVGTTTPIARLCVDGTAPGPSIPPVGAVVVGVADDAVAVVGAHGAGTTFWFASGRHSLRAPVVAERADRFVGAPGAVLDGGFRGHAAFTGGGTDVRIEHLTIERFGTEAGRGFVNAAAVNRSVAARWTVTDSTLRLNDGNALFLGEGAVAARNCFAENGQTGLAAPAQRAGGEWISLSGIVVTDNDVRDNNRNDLEASPGSCRGCTAGMKLWETTGAVVARNVVTGNHGVGIWLDNNNVGATVSDNVVASNDGEGIMVETSSSVTVTGNVVDRNAVVEGRARSDSFPVAGIFVSNSSGVNVSGNRLTDNWNGVVVFWNADRYCSSAADTSVGHCTSAGGSVDACAAAVERRDVPTTLVDRCHWTARDVTVHDNVLRNSEALVAGCAGRCGRNGLIATTAPATTTVRRSDGSTRAVANPLPGTWAQDLVADPATNSFTSNRYDGSWRFDLRASGRTVGLDGWRAAGHDT